MARQRLEKGFHQPQRCEGPIILICNKVASFPLNELIYFISALAMPAIVRPNNLYRFGDTATPALITF